MISSDSGFNAGAEVITERQPTAAGGVWTAPSNAEFGDLDRIRDQVRACCREQAWEASEVVMVALLRARLDVRRMSPWQWRALVETAFAEARAALS